MQIFKKQNKDTQKSELDTKTQCPQYSDGIENYKIETYKASTVRIGKVHSVGKRDNQQDSFAYSDVSDPETVSKKGMLLLVADGMGGMSNGAEVSAKVAVEALRFFDDCDVIEDVPQFLYDMVQYINMQVNDLLGYNGIGKSGSTLVAMHIRNHEAYWISIGDSCVYLYQYNELIRLNVLHNYETQLMEMVDNGEISYEEAMSKPNKAALTSYIGAGEIALIDQNVEPLILEPRARMILMSDGIETLSEEEMAEVLRFDVEEAALKMRYLIEQKNKRNQDNFTAIVIEDNY